MAPSVLTTKLGTLTIDNDVHNVIGHGAYGIVYNALDEHGNKFAAKRIKTDDKLKLSRISGDLEKLIQLTHPNIVKVYDICQKDGIIWIIMELCQHGDLHKFYKGKTLNPKEQLEVMTQIAKGVAYLHDNNIVHRDIKPENILIASEDPICVKLTDFDVSKFLDDFYKTSAMSTNVGTLAFKAPEFFQRTPEGKYKYHRKVDIFAAGLTFLAITQQQNGQKKPLLPRIETPQDDSELHAPSIGQLIAERIKYKVPDLNIVPVVALDDVTNVCDGEITKEIKDIIRQMTNACPKDRLSATAVVQKFRSAKGRLRKMKIKPQTKQGFKRGLVLDEIIPAKFTCTREVNINSLFFQICTY